MKRYSVTVNAKNMLETLIYTIIAILLTLAITGLHEAAQADKFNDDDIFDR